MTDIKVSPKDKRILQALAYRQQEISERQIEQEKRDLWYRHNSLELTRPVIFCDPENGWHEIITDESCLLYTSPSPRD